MLTGREAGAQRLAPSAARKREALHVCTAMLLGFLACTAYLALIAGPASAPAAALPRPAPRHAATGSAATRDLAALVPRHPAQDRPYELMKAAFVIMAGPGALKELLKTLPRLWKYFLWQFPYPVYILMEPGKVEEEEVVRLKQNERLAHLIHLVHFIDMGPLWGFPPDFDSANPGFNTSNVIWPNRYPGYHHMCRFWAMNIWHHPNITTLDYYCRLDSHSWIFSPIRYDLFRFMDVNSRSYGYNHIQRDEIPVVTNLWTFADKWTKTHKTYARKNNILWPWPRWAWDVWGIEIYYNNFEVVKVAAFRDNPAIAEFNAAVDKSRNIYRWRWGDAPLRWLQVNLFMDVARDAWRFRDFEYSHPVDWNKVVSFKRKCKCCECKKGSKDALGDEHWGSPEMYEEADGNWDWDENKSEWKWIKVDASKNATAIRPA